MLRVQSPVRPVQSAAWSVRRAHVSVLLLSTDSAARPACGARADGITAGCSMCTCSYGLVRQAPCCDGAWVDVLCKSHIRCTSGTSILPGTPGLPAEVGVDAWFAA